MKIRSTKPLLFVFFLSISTLAVAQDKSADTTQHYRTFSAGVNAGMLTHWTPFDRATNGDYRTPKQTFGYGIFVKDQLLPTLGLQADLFAGQIKAERLNVIPEGTAQDISGYTADIHWSAALSAYLTIPNLSITHKNYLFNPYLTLGAGYMSFSTTVRNTPPAADNINAHTWYLPLGVGFKLGLSNTINIDLGYTVLALKTNNFDGYRSALNDHMSYAHAGLEYTFGKKNLPQLQNYSALARLHDQTQAEDRILKKQLEDQLLDSEKMRLAERQQYIRDMADDDHDGVANKFDKCPGTPPDTQVDGAGCPIKIPVVTEKIITERDRRVIGDAIKNLEFEYGKAIIKKRSYDVLDRVADLLINKDFSLKLAGHTDNKGTMAANLRLSKARAEAVKAYLISKGANASRIEATGYGFTQPIATNKTAQGRQQNRRVEFSLL